jgi:hypothetical protein
MDIFRDMIAYQLKILRMMLKVQGDKHETALSMMHLEQEKLNAKLREVLQQKTVLDKINPDIVSDSDFGCLVRANGIYLYLSLALPKLILKE